EKRQVVERRRRAESVIEHRKRDPPDLANSRVAARERERTKGRKPHEAAEIREQKFTAPGVAVASIAGSVEREPEHRAVKPVLRHRAGNVRMMVLNLHR